MSRRTTMTRQQVTSDGVNKYLSLMEEIKQRTRLVKAIGETSSSLFPMHIRVEMLYLQFRKILELIAMGSLVANADALSQIQPNLHKYWRAKDLLRDIKNINQSFYPEPIIQKESNDPNIRMEWPDRSDDYLTEARFLTLYDNCADVLHARNPYGSKLDYKRLEKMGPKWYLQIINLLNAPIIHLVDEDNIWLIQMGTDIKPPTYTYFSKLKAG